MTFWRTCARRSSTSARRFSAISRMPPTSPARTTPMNMDENTAGWWLMAVLSVWPSSTRRARSRAVARRRGVALRSPRICSDRSSGMPTSTSVESWRANAAICRTPGPKRLPPRPARSRPPPSAGRGPVGRNWPPDPCISPSARMRLMIWSFSDCPCASGFAP